MRACWKESLLHVNLNADHVRGIGFLHVGITCDAWADTGQLYLFKLLPKKVIERAMTMYSQPNAPMVWTVLLALKCRAEGS